MYETEADWMICEKYPRYSVSRSGSIRYDGAFVKSRNGSKYWRKGRILVKIAHHSGYEIVRIGGDGVFKNVSVHRLVAIAFIPNPENKPQVNHKNGVKNDNQVDNLEWVTQKENGEHANHVIKTYKKGEAHFKSKITEDDARDIRALDFYGATYLAIGAVYDLSKSAVSHIVSRRSWKHI